MSVKINIINSKHNITFGDVFQGQVFKFPNSKDFNLKVDIDKYVELKENGYEGFDFERLMNITDNARVSEVYDVELGLSRVK